MSETLPTSVHSGDVTLLGVTMTVHVLDNGQRIIEGDGFERLMEALMDPATKPATDADLEALADLVGRAPR